MNVYKTKIKFWRYRISMGIYTKCNYPSSFFTVLNPISKSYWFSLNILGTMLRIVLRVHQNLKGFEVYDVEWVPKTWVEGSNEITTTKRFLPYWGVYKVKNKQELLDKLKIEEKGNNDFVAMRSCLQYPILVEGDQEVEKRC